MGMVMAMVIGRRMIKMKIMNQNINQANQIVNWIYQMILVSIVDHQNLNQHLIAQIV